MFWEGENVRLVLTPRDSNTKDLVSQVKKICCRCLLDEEIRDKSSKQATLVEQAGNSGGDKHTDKHTC